MSSPLDVGPAASSDDAPQQGRAPLVRLAILAACLVAGWLIIQAVGRIDWSAVLDGLGRLEWWQFAILVLMLSPRQTLNALPLAFFIPGLGVYKAVVNDLTAHLLAVIAPPPGDLVLRVGMFTSWGIDASKAIAGTVMNMLAFYVNRFSVPLIGFLILLPVRYDSGYALTALVCTAIALTMVTVIALGLRSAAFAEGAGLKAGSLAAKVRRSIDPQAWAASILTFRNDMQSKFVNGSPRAILSLVALVFVDATMVLLALRFVGVGASDVPAIEIYAAFLCVYPLTLFPFMGLGIADAVLVATFVGIGGLEIESAVVAGLVVWRTVTLIGPVLLGSVSMAVWRHGQRAAGRSEVGPNGRPDVITAEEAGPPTA